MQVRAVVTNGGDTSLALGESRVFAIAEGIGRRAVEAARAALGAVREDVEVLDEQARRVDHDRGTSARLALLSVLEDVAVHADGAILRVRRPDEWMAAGLLVAVVAGGRVHVATVGSSRAYVVRRGVSTRINRDRSDEALGTTLPVDVDVAEAALEDGDTLVLVGDRLAADLGEDGLAIALGAPTGPDLGRLASDVPGGLVAVRVAGTSPSDAARVLGQTFLFRSLTGPERQAVAPYLDDRVLAPGDVLVREGDYGDEFFAVVEGRLRVSTGDVHLRDLGPGAHIGELALCGTGRRSATAAAVEPTRVLSMSQASFEALVNRRPEIGVRVMYALMTTLGDQLRDLTDRVSMTLQRAR